METQIGQKAPSLVKEGLLVFLGIILAFAAIPLSFIVHIGVGDAVFVVGLVLAVMFTAKKLKKKAFGSQRALSKFAIISESIGTSIFLLILLVVMVILNILLL